MATKKVTTAAATESAVVEDTAVTAQLLAAVQKSLEGPAVTVFSAINERTKLYQKGITKREKEIEARETALSTDGKLAKFTARLTTAFNAGDAAEIRKVGKQFNDYKLPAISDEDDSDSE